jgi:prepilin-type N-terminal cleavage/methylation domain-containing protein
MNSGRQRGFSLLEMLLTLFVIGVFTRLVIFNIGSGDRDILLQSAVESLAKSANYALDEAQFSGMNYGLMLHREPQGGQWRYRYDWWEQGPTGWRPPASGKGVFTAGALPEGLDLELELDGVLQDAETLVAQPENPQPQIILYASGETVPGVLDFRETQSGQLAWRIEWQLLGPFEAYRRGELPEEEAQ